MKVESRRNIAIILSIVGLAVLVVGCSCSTPLNRILYSGRPSRAGGDVRLTLLSAKMLSGNDYRVEVLYESTIPFWELDSEQYLGDFDLAGAGNEVPIYFVTYSVDFADENVGYISAGQSEEITITFKNVVGKPGILIYESFHADGKIKLPLK